MSLKDTVKEAMQTAKDKTAAASKNPSESLYAGDGLLKNTMDSPTINQTFVRWSNSYSGANIFGSNIKKNRLNLLPSRVAFEFNTYKNWAPFRILSAPPSDFVFNDGDVSATMWEDEKGVTNVEYLGVDKTVAGGPIGRRSLFNLYTAVNETNLQRLRNNAPLLNMDMDPEERMKNDCDIRSLIAATTTGEMGVETYAWADFMYCKYLGKVSNEYMITLRRFPYPPGDHINKLHDEEQQNHVGDIGRMITWMGTPGNEMSNILKYNVKIPYKIFKAEIQEVSEEDQNGNSILGGLMGLGNKDNQEKIINGMGGTHNIEAAKQAFAGVATAMGAVGLTGAGKGVGTLSSLLGNPPNSYQKWQTNYDKNKSYGPLDVITEAYQRAGAADGGLEFSQDIQLQFEYEMRSYDGVNAKSAMLDLIANVLATCYTTGKFWGGSYRFLGASQSNLYANLPIFMNTETHPGNMAKYSRTIADMISNPADMGTASNRITHYENKAMEDAKQKALADKKNKKYLADKFENLGELASNAINSFKSMFSLDNIGNMLQNAGSALGSLIYGGLVNKLGRPAVLCVNSLLSDAPTGLWHLTIGNPKSPIMSMGNMFIKECSIEHTGALGIDGFPSGLKVNMTLAHAKPRDNTAIERMYMHGDYRIYSPMGDMIYNVYKGSPTLEMFKESNTVNKKLQALPGDVTDSMEYYLPDGINFDNVLSGIESEDAYRLGYSRYFGTANTMKYINITGQEALFGSTNNDDASENDNTAEVLKKMQEKQQQSAANVEDEKNKEVIANAENDLKTLKAKLRANGEYEYFSGDDYGMKFTVDKDYEIDYNAYITMFETQGINSEMHLFLKDYMDLLDGTYEYKKSQKAFEARVRLNHKSTANDDYRYGDTFKHLWNYVHACKDVEAKQQEIDKLKAELKS